MREISFTLALVFVTMSTFASIPAPDKAKAVLQEIKRVQDIKRLLYPAKVDAKINSTVTADLDGHILKLNKSLGSRVKRGEVVMMIENRDPAFTYSAVPVRSPISGIISQLSLQIMAKVAKGTPLFTVMNAEAMTVTAEVPAADLALIRTGSTGIYEDKNGAVPVKVIGLSPIVDPRTGTAGAEMEFVAAAVTKSKDKKDLETSPSPRPPVGSVGRVSFQITSGDILLLPEASISYLEGKPTVRVIDKDNRAHRRNIEIGEQREDLIVVKAGLKEGERIVIRSSKGLKDGEEVEVQSEDINKKAN